MPDPLGELNSRIAELKVNLTFVALASKLRPRIGEAIQWSSQGEVLSIIRDFMNSKAVRAEGVYGSLFVALMASFERYIRLLIIHAVELLSAKAKTYDELPPQLARRNLVLTGRVLAASDAPRDYLTLDIHSLISNLASCKSGNAAFRLNAKAFCTTVTGSGPAVIEEALKLVGVQEFWDEVGSETKLAELLGSTGPRETGSRARERLKDLCRWRNQLAHGGDEEIALSESQIREAIDFVLLFGSGLSKAVNKHLHRSN